MNRETVIEWAMKIWDTFRRDIIFRPLMKEIALRTKGGFEGRWAKAIPLLLDGWVLVVDEENFYLFHYSDLKEQIPAKRITTYKRLQEQLIEGYKDPGRADKTILPPTPQPWQFYPTVVAERLAQSLDLMTKYNLKFELEAHKQLMEKFNE